MPKKRSNGEGNLRKRKNGTWELAIFLGVDENGKKKTKSFYGKTQKEVKEKANRFRAELDKGLKLDTSLTFGTWADEWYENYKDQVSACTYENYRFTLNLLKDEFETTKLTDIKTFHVEKFLKRMAKEGRSQSSLAKLRGMMFQIFKKACANDLLVKNPVEYADKTKAAPQESKKDSFKAAELERMMLFLPDNRIGHSVRLMLATGMRTQEIMALEPRHIAADGSSIHIEQAITMVKGTPQIGPPKTKTSYRDIPVPQKARGSALFLRDTSFQYVWHNKQGRYCNPSSFRKEYRQALEKLGGVRILSPHCCRHTYVSQLQASGVPLETIQSLTGHADCEMTEHYLHVQPEVRKKAVEQLNDLL